MSRSAAAVVCLAITLAACARRERGEPPVDGGGSGDGAVLGDSGPLDAGVPDADRADGAGADGAASERDGGAVDAGVFDAGGPDAAAADAGPADAGPADAGPADAGPADAGPPDAGPPDAGPVGGCVSGATGTHAVRFEWAGSGPGSTAYVRYETNELPDTSRWRVSAASMSIGYVPQYGDTFLGDGGLVLEGTVFIDVELSTVGLSSIRDVTLAIRGRSYNTTTSGSFSWQTFTGTGASPYGSVYNSAPYQWYGADATTAFAPGDSGVYLRIRAGPPSGSLIVNRVELCFDAS